MKPLNFIAFWMALLGVGLSVGVLAPVRALAMNSSGLPVDLHAHLFMPEAVGLDSLGGFSEPIRAKTWKDRFKMRVNAASLDRSGFGVVVVALYANLFFKGSERDSIRRQLAVARQFVAATPGWRIVRTPEELQEAFVKGDRALVFSLEGASGVLETRKDVDEFVDREGIRIVGLTHFMDDGVGGAALMPSKSLGWLANPFAWLRSKSLGITGEAADERVTHSPVGLREAGRELLDLLLRKKVWIDLSHASDALLTELMPLLEKANQPLLLTHSMLRSRYRAERGAPRVVLQAIAKSRGLVGVIPSDDITGETPFPEQSSSCAGGPGAFLSHAREIEAIVGKGAVGIGSDVGAPLRFLPASCAKRSSDASGFFEYGQFEELHRELGPEAPRVLGHQFLEAWRRVVNPPAPSI